MNLVWRFLEAGVSSNTLYRILTLKLELELGYLETREREKQNAEGSFIPHLIIALYASLSFFF